MDDSDCDDSGPDETEDSKAIYEDNVELHHDSVISRHSQHDSQHCSSSVVTIKFPVTYFSGKANPPWFRQYHDLNILPSKPLLPMLFVWKYHIVIILKMIN